ncbi:MAG TPA: alpha/beta fold hydrolase [Candidatus Solibacter sp.]|nr:alpha/beta fold hydrolase [Candidatus Solibacter sp.]
MSGSSKHPGFEYLGSEPFVPRRFLRNKHAQTLAGNFLPRESRLPEPEERLFQVEEDVQVLCHCHWQPERAGRMTVIILHGLEGSSLSQYVIGTGSKAWDAGMNVVRMNMRNCGGTEKLTPTLYHSGFSGDVGAVARTLIEQEKLQHIAVVGYSMGGNLVLKLAGEWGSAAPRELKAVAAVSPSADLAACADAIHELKSNRIYEWKFLGGLMRRYDRKRLLFPEIYREVERKPRSIREFDDTITARYSGFSGADDYYSRAAAARVIDKIAVPTLVIHAKDDPFIRILPETREKLASNAHITLIEPDHGGHCAFLAQPNGYDGRWAERRVIHFFEQISLNSGRPDAG